MDYEDLLKDAYEKIKPVESKERFEIPKAKGFYEGTKTIIRNFSQIASHFRRDPNHFARFLAKNLASSFEINNDMLILFRRINANEINEKIEKYAQQFVICQKCGKPDTEIIAEKDGLYLKCLACGEKRRIHNV